MSFRLSIVTLAVLLIGGTLLFAAPSNTDRAAKLCDKGFKALESDDVTRAATSFEKALEMAPAFPDAHLGLGHVAMKDGRFEEALSQYEAARDGWTTMGDELFDRRMKQYHAGRQDIPKLQQEAGLIISGQIKMGDGDRRLRLKEIDDRIRYFETMPPPTKEDAESPGEVDFHLGNALSRLKRWEEAVEAYESCIKKSPEFAQVHNNIALAYWRVGRIESALASLDKAEEMGLQVNPKFRADIEKSRKPDKS